MNLDQRADAAARELLDNVPDDLEGMLGELKRTRRRRTAARGVAAAVAVVAAVGGWALVRGGSAEPPDPVGPVDIPGRITYGLWDRELGDFQIWFAEPDGSDHARLIEGPSWQSDWAPDGRYLVYEDPTGLAIVNTDGPGERRLRTDLGTQWSPDWSPTGDWITFEGSRERVPDSSDFSGPPTSIWVISPDGEGLREVLPGVFGVEPVFSPGGDQIAFGHVTKEASWRWAEQAIEVVGLDGTGRRQIVPPRPGLQHVDWSVDDWLLFNIAIAPLGKDGPPDQGTIFAVRPDGSDLHVVRRGDDEVAFSNAVWSPDGTQILAMCFNRQRGLDMLCRMDGDGGDLEVIDVDQGSMNAAGFPAWGGVADPDAEE